MYYSWVKMVDWTLHKFLRADGSNKGPNQTLPNLTKNNLTKNNLT